VVDDKMRQEAVDALCEAFAEDRIPVEEFEKRVEGAHRADTRDELQRLLVGIPGTEGALAPTHDTSARGEARPAPAAADAPTTGETAPAVRAWARPTLPAERVRPTSVVAGVLGGATRRGAWHPARNNYAIGIMGGFELDFREAVFPPGVTELTLFCFWGGGEIVVPPDVAVDVDIIGVLGGVEYTHGTQSTLHPDAPVLRITGFALMGGAEVSVRYPEEGKKEARRRRREEKKARRRLRRGDDGG
jgi:hypothetical protein